MPFLLNGRVALVTGAGRGIGRATARIMAEAGCDVVLVGRDATALTDAAGEVAAAGRAALVAPGDVRAGALPARVIADTLARFGRLDILVNNAGALSAGPIEEIEDDIWQEMLATNLSAAYRFCRAAFGPMRLQGWGRMINIASITAQTGGVSGSVAYSAAKGGLLALTRTLARDGAAHGITANAVAPGQIDTGMSRTLTPEALRARTAIIPLGRLGTPEEIGYAVLFLASEEAAYITGATLDVNGGILKR
jgi:NAD(P)-dependent dehydrogenase (short-subunit alcohol dehydrogenase family)